MSKAIVIKNANFSGNALDHIIFDGTHAESITISQSTATFDAIGSTLQLSYTVVPSDSTDAILWSSSDENVATVSNNGLVTVVGCGQCNITVQAGSVQSVCAITVAVELSFGRYTKTSISASNNSNMLTSTTDLTGSSNTSNNIYLAACIGQQSYNDLIVSYDFTKKNDTTGNYELVTTREELANAGLTGAVRVLDHIGFPVPIVLPQNCSKIRCVGLNNHYGAYPLFFKRNVNAYPEGSGTTGKAHWCPARALSEPISNFSFSYQQVQEFDVPSGYDSIAITWKADGETGTVNPVDLSQTQINEFKIIAL